MREVDADLYEFLNENETGMSIENNEVVAYVFIYFYNIAEFIGVVGFSYFGEEAINCKLKKDYICIGVNEIIEYEGHKLSHYKNCFDEDDWNQYGERILKSEEE